MTLRSQLETRIAECLAHLSDDGMQRVAEDYARIRFPDRFPRFDFRAFSKEGKSRSGWPDAWIDLEDRIDGVEATGAKAKPAVVHHLGEDLEKARRRAPRLTGFVFVSGHPEVQLTKRELRIWRRRFIDEAGIDPDRLQLVFGGGLVGELARPEFARTRIELLGLSETTHFKLVRPGLGPDEGRLNSAFIPSAEDYAAGRVHRPQAADQVLAHLARDGRALVRGIGASGKTVLAWLLALDAAEHRRPSYYLDLARAETGQNIGNALTEDLHRCGHPQVLFVLDNCHLDEPLAKELALAWEDLVPSQRPRLLLLGRELRTGRGSPIDGLPIPTLALKAQQPEVLGVYWRLAYRHTGERAPPEPLPPTLDAWVATFGGDPTSPDTTTDLIAFSAAVLRRMPALLQRDWTLHVSDAVDEIRIAYLDKLCDEGETRNLMRLCAMEELELSLAEQALPDPRAGFNTSSRRLGLVFRYTTGASQQWVRYRLAHAALSNLIHAAAYQPVDRVSERRTAALQYPPGGAMTIARLATLESMNEGRELASAMLGRPECLLELGSLLYLYAFLIWARRLKVPLPHDLGEILTVDAHRKRLVERVMQTPLGDLKAFLEYAAKTDELKLVFAALSRELTKPENRKPLVERARVTSLHFIASFLEYAANTAELEPVFAALADDLANPETLPTLVKRALQTPLGDLKTFLEYTANTAELEPVFAALAKDLALPENLSTLVESAIVTPLDHLQSFLIFVAGSTNLRLIFKGVFRELSVPAKRAQLVRRFETAGLDKLVSVLSAEVTRELWDSVFADVDADAWTRSRANDSATGLDAFVAFQHVAGQKGRPELAQAPALSLVLHSRRGDWHRSGIAVPHLTHVLRCARGASAADIQEFLERVASPDWVDGQLEGASTGGLAGALLSLAGTLEPKQRGKFLRDALYERVVREISRRGERDADSWAEALSLLGAAAAIGIPIPRLDTDWPDTATLAGILDLRKPNPEWTTIKPLQAQLWLGLREMTRLRAGLVTVPPRFGNRILALWQATEDGQTGDSLPTHVRARNAEMIAWLQHCKAAGWRLVPPQTERAMDKPDGKT